jgi:hypothetical protein
LSSSPASTSSAIGPSITLSQNRCRAPRSGIRAFVTLRKRAASAASRPNANGTACSMIPRSLRASSGEAPAVEIAICTGARSTSAGMMNVERDASSATLTGIRSARAEFATASFAAASSVAAIATSAPSRSPGWKRRASWRIAPSVASSARPHAQVRRDHGDANARAQQRLDLARRDRAAADDDAGLAAQVEERGEVGAVSGWRRWHGSRAIRSRALPARRRASRPARAPAADEDPDRAQPGDQQGERPDPEHERRALHRRTVEHEVAVALDHIVADLLVGFSGLDLLAHLALQIHREVGARGDQRFVLADEAAQLFGDRDEPRPRSWDRPRAAPPRARAPCRR